MSAMDYLNVMFGVVHILAVRVWAGATFVVENVLEGGAEEIQEYYVVVQQIYSDFNKTTQPLMVWADLIDYITLGGAALRSALMRPDASLGSLNLQVQFNSPWDVVVHVTRLLLLYPAQMDCIPKRKVSWITNLSYSALQMAVTALYFVGIYKVSKHLFIRLRKVFRWMKFLILWQFWSIFSIGLCLALIVYVKIDAGGLDIISDRYFLLMSRLLGLGFLFTLSFFLETLLSRILTWRLNRWFVRFYFATIVYTYVLFFILLPEERCGTLSGDTWVCQLLNTFSWVMQLVTRVIYVVFAMNASYLGLGLVARSLYLFNL